MVISCTIRKSWPPKALADLVASRQAQAKLQWHPATTTSDGRTLDGDGRSPLTASKDPRPKVAPEALLDLRHRHPIHAKTHQHILPIQRERERDMYIYIYFYMYIKKNLCLTYSIKFKVSPSIKSRKGCSAHLTPPLAPSKGEVPRATSASRS